MNPNDSARWLLMMHQLPAKPAYFRVKIWRRLQGIGAVAVKNACYALPANEQTQEDFEWLRKEIVDGGGEAMICEARLLDGLSDAEVRGQFDAARNEDYEAVAAEARAIADTLAAAPTDEQRSEVKGQVTRLRTRLAQIAAIDFFGANSRDAAEGLVAALESRMKEGMAMQETTAELPDKLDGRTWVTRRGVQSDRIASAWLIQRFIDPRARFKFVDGRGYRPEPGELRFDMFEAEYTHEGDNCTFEVLLRRGGLEDLALQAIAEIIHDIDLKDAKFGRAEAAGIAQLISGIAQPEAGDDERLKRGNELFNGLYESFRKKAR